LCENLPREAGKFINKYLDLPQHEINKAQKDGEFDGKKNIPKPDENDVSGVVLKILTDARSAWDKYLSEKKVYLKEIKKKLSDTDYDIDTNSGRLMFQTGSGKKIVFNDMKLGVTLNKTWKGKKDSEFFSYGDHKKILSFALADI